MINKEDFYLKDIELCRSLEPIMKKKGIFADRILVNILTPIQGKPIGHLYSTDKLNGYERELVKKKSIAVYSTYRKDSLEAALPEWFFIPEMNSLKYADIEYQIMKRKKDFEPHHAMGFVILRQDMSLKRGQESLKAIARLIILLDREGIE